jgi:predicted lipoprotein with Yx(FWY)xxD motif
MKYTIAAVTLVAACGGGSAETTTTTIPAATTTAAPATTSAPTTTAAPTTTTAAPTTTTLAGPVIAIATTDRGDVLVDDTGMTLYLFLPDEQGPSTCTGGCATTWPPLTGEFAAGDGIDADLLGTVARGDGTLQVTYNGWPLYGYGGDSEPGDTSGQGLGGNWWVVDAAGEPVM